MVQQNRPYSAMDVWNNLRQEYPKAVRLRRFYAFLHICEHVNKNSFMGTSCPSVHPPLCVFSPFNRPANMNQTRRADYLWPWRSDSFSFVPNILFRIRLQILSSFQCFCIRFQPSPSYFLPFVYQVFFVGSKKRMMHTCSLATAILFL